MLPTCIRAYLRVCACGLITRAHRYVGTKKKPNPIHIIRHVYDIIIILYRYQFENLITTCDRCGCNGYATAAVNAHLVTTSRIRVMIPRRRY